MMRMLVSLVILGMALLVLSGAAGAGTARQTADVLDQMQADGTREALVADGASLVRSRTSLAARVAMPTPPPGTYTYPDEGVFAEQGHPEGFTLWAFVFNTPDACEGPCDLGDFSNPDTQSGAFFVAGHMVGGPHLTLSGQLSQEDEPAVGAPLGDAREAAVLLAVAPHGGLDPDLMPAQIKAPTRPPGVWWLALFPAPA